MENDISGSYPIIIDGATEGNLTVSREGPFWRFDAKCGLRPGIVRLSVYGGGKEGYLGVMEPGGDALRLLKKLSRSALSSFPDTIDHAGIKNEPASAPAPRPELYSEAPAAAPDSAAAQEVGTHFPLPYEYDDITVNDMPPETNIPPPSSKFSPPHSHGAYAWRPCAIPCSLFTGIAEKQLCASFGGCLLTNDGDALLLAVPEAAALCMPCNNVIHFLYKMIISGKNYLICGIENGKSVSER